MLCLSKSYFFGYLEYTLEDKFTIFFGKSNNTVSTKMS